MHGTHSTATAPFADRLARKAQKAMKKAPAAEPNSVKIVGMWPAYAVEGKGHDDSDGKDAA